MRNRRESYPWNSIWMAEIEEASSVLCDTKLLFKLKGKFYQTTVRHVMLYVTKCWVVKNQHKYKICCFGCVVRLDEIRLEMTILKTNMYYLLMVKLIFNFVRIWLFIVGLIHWCEVSLDTWCFGCRVIRVS